jgi:ATP-dependent DNA helicase RecQ
VSEEQANSPVDVLIGPADGTVDGLSTGPQTARFLVSDLSFPREIQAPLTAATPAVLSAPNREDARWFLNYLFRKSDFWEGQWETVERSLRGQDSVVLLPTGGGKSIAFQLAALLLPGRCIVVDPIISLIDDQIDNLSYVGIDRCIGITSQLRADERERALRALETGHYLFCYVAPERFQTAPFRETLRALTTHTPISLITIDEAHCVSEWGHDFRTAYLNLGRIAREYCASQEIVPPLVALTGTASKIVLRDVQRELGITAFDAIVTPKTFDRPELRFRVLKCPSSEKNQRVQGLIDRLPSDFGVQPSTFFRSRGSRTHAGLVFCPHVNGQYGVVEQRDQLAANLGTRVDVYSGEPPRNIDRGIWEERKHQIAHDFKRNRTTMLVCTKAFGMGIDKPNVRYTVHIGLPSSIESFYQEAGRAGRDRNRAECAIVLSNDDRARSQRILNPTTPLGEVAQIVDGTSRDEADDIVRALYFHVHAFRGEQAEVGDIETMLDQLGDLTRRRRVNISWRDERWSSGGPRGDDSKERAEKALHRLVVVGVVSDYTVEYASHEFQVQIPGASQEEIAAVCAQYAGSYQRRLGEEMEREVLSLRRQPHRSFVVAVAGKLVSFIYQHIELARRRALNEMLQAASGAKTGEDLRRRILEYLQQSEWDDRLDEVRNSRSGGLNVLGPLLDDLVSANDAAALRGAVARVLSSYPDVPGFLLLRSVTEALSPDATSEVVRQNMEATLTFAFDKFRLDSSEIANAVGQVIKRARDKEGAAELLLAASLMSPKADRPFLRDLLRHLPIELAVGPARRLNIRLVALSTKLRTSRGG